MIVMHIFQLSNFQLCINCNCLPYLFLYTLSPQRLKQVSLYHEFLCLELCYYIILLCKLLHNKIQYYYHLDCMKYSCSSFQQCMVFLANAHTHTKHWYMEVVTRYVSFKGLESGKAWILLSLGLKLMGAVPYFLICVLTSTCLHSFNVQGTQMKRTFYLKFICSAFVVCIKITKSWQA